MKTEREVMDKVFEVIDKHKSYHESELKNIKLKIEIANLVCDNEDHFIIREYLEEYNSHASAMACLEMLKLELNGEREY